MHLKMSFAKWWPFCLYENVGICMSHQSNLLALTSCLVSSFSGDVAQKSPRWLISQYTHTHVHNFVFNKLNHRHKKCSIFFVPVCNTIWTNKTVMLWMSVGDYGIFLCPFASIWTHCINSYAVIECNICRQSVWIRWLNMNNWNSDSELRISWYFYW